MLISPPTRANPGSHLKEIIVPSVVSVLVFRGTPLGGGLGRPQETVCNKRTPLHSHYRYSCAMRLSIVTMLNCYYIDNHGSDYLGMTGKKWSQFTNFQPTLSWFNCVLLQDKM